MNNRYIGQNELKAIVEVCEASNPLWDALTWKAPGGVAIDIEDFTINVYDQSGGYLGQVMWSDDGPAFYPDLTILKGE